MKQSKQIKKISLAYDNIAHILEETMKAYGQLPAYNCLGQSFSYNDIEDKSAALACYLLDVAQLKSGDRVAIQLPNITQYPIAAFAVLRAGLVLVNTNPLYTAREMGHQFSDSGAKAVIILEDLLPTLQSIIGSTQIETIISTGVTDLLSQQYKPSEVPHLPFSNTIGFVDAIAKGGEYKKIVRSAILLNDIAAIQYTGGTTGLSKGAVLTHKNLLSNIEQTSERLSTGVKNATGNFITPLPLYHIYAFLLNIWVFSKGINNVLIPNPRDIDGFIDTLTVHSPSGFCGINTLFLGLCHHPKISKVNFNHLSFTVSGGAALTTAAVASWKNITGCTISEGYGLSETSPVVCLNQPGYEQIGTIGKPLIATEVQIWDDNDQELPLGERGEIVVRGPQVMQGYWQQPVETKNVFSDDGWFKTGDIAIQQSDGFFRIVDRKKDMINVSGFNVYPNEVEDILMSHPAVIEAAVIGVACEKSGEMVSAFVVLNQIVTSEQAIIVYCKTLLTPYKVPKKITFLQDLPKSAIGKVLRKNLR